MNARVRLPKGLSKLLRSDIEQAIYEANLGTEDTGIATRYLIEHWPQIDIAAQYGCDRSTISKRMPHIVERVQYAAARLGYIEK